MKDFKNENEYGNMKLENETFEGILLKTGDEGYRYYSSSDSSTSSTSYNSSLDCAHCHGAGWFSSTSNCSWCDAWQTNLAPISCTYSYESVTTSGANITISGVCGNANDMYIYVGESLSSSMTPSAHASSNNISERFFLESGKTYQVRVKAESNACGSDFKQFTIIVNDMEELKPTTIDYCYSKNGSGYADLTDDEKIAVCRGELFRHDPITKKPIVRFLRFVSLVPNVNFHLNKNTAPLYDKNDNSMIQAEITDLKIDNEVWDGNKISYAWSVQSQNISSLAIAGIHGESDEILIKHETMVH